MKSISTGVSDWRPIAHDKLYEVSRFGLIRNAETGLVLRPMLSNGYQKVCLRDGSRRYVHRLVLEAWVGARPPRHQANHKNGIRADNRADNLEWVTPSRNVKHSYDELRHTRMRGERSGKAILTEAQVIEMRELRRQGWMNKDIAHRFGMSIPGTQAILVGRRWAHLL